MEPVGKIYEIVGGGKCYIGSTFQTLNRRLSKHRSNKKMYDEKKKKEWTSCYEILNEPDYKINLIEEYKNISKKDLQRIEGQHILNRECVNKMVPGRTSTELYSIKKNEYAKKNKIRNKIKVKCEKCNTEITKCNLNRHTLTCGNTNNKTGHENIYKTKYNKFQVQITKKGERICKTFNTINEAIEFRNSAPKDGKIEYEETIDERSDSD